MKTFVLPILIACLTCSLSYGQERKPVEVYSVIETTKDGRDIVVTRMALSLPGKPWSGVPGRGLDFPISESRFDSQSGLEGRLSLFGKTESQLELSKAQQGELAELRKEFIGNSKDIVTAFIENKGGKLSEEDEAQLLTKMTDFKTEFESKYTDVLLPHQTKMLKQFAFGKRFKLGMLAFFKLPEVKKELGLTKDQLKKVDNIQRDLTKDKRDLEIEFKRKMRELVEKSEKDTRDVLTKRQQNKLEELTGLGKK